jgi:tRNA nucleotidyltransferase/poly(A) polymerase
MTIFDLPIIPAQKGVYLVGGSLRDALLGRTPLDYDIVVKDNPLAFAREIATQRKGRLVFMGQPGRRLIRIIFQNTCWDVSAMKGGSIEEDLNRRDFTINALAYETATAKLIDITKGLDDLKKRRIRMVSTSIFKEDPLRLLRAYRLAASLGFRLDSATTQCLRRDAPLIRHAAGERIRDEWFKLLALPDALPFIRRMQSSGLLFELLPELAALKGSCRNRHHAYDALEHTLKAFCTMETLLKNVASRFPEYAVPLNHWFDQRRKPLIKCAVLLHDIGKPLCETRDESGNAHFLGHPKTGSMLAREIGRRLRFSAHEIDYITFMVRSHSRPLSLFTARRNKTLTDRGIAGFFIGCGPHAPDVLLHAVADAQAKNRVKEDSGAKVFADFINELMHRYFTRCLPIQTAPALISGRDLIEILHLRPSALFKTILSRVAKARLAGDVATRDEALRLASSIAAAKKAESS